MIHRIAILIDSYEITNPDLIINWDQSGVMLMPTYKHTYNKTGNDQVPIVALEDHRQITAVVGGTLAGNLLPLQLIFTGQQVKSSQVSRRALMPQH